jgi:hypothetical protein
LFQQPVRRRPVSVTKVPKRTDYDFRPPLDSNRNPIPLVAIVTPDTVLQKPARSMSQEIRLPQITKVIISVRKREQVKLEREENGKTNKQTILYPEWNFSDKQIYADFVFAFVPHFHFLALTNMFS